jgi:hypothetical protein
MGWLPHGIRAGSLATMRHSTALCAVVAGERVNGSSLPRVVFSLAAA